MKPFVACVSAALLATAPLLDAEDAAAAPSPAPAESATSALAKNVVDELTEAELDDFVAQLKAHFIKPQMLSELDLKRATAQGLLARLAPGVELLKSAPTETAAASPFRSEVLDGRIGYTRVGSLAAETVTALDTALGGFSEQKLPALVLDLRATPAGSDFEQAGHVCRRFVPKGKILFMVKKPGENHEEVVTSKEEPKFGGVMVVLVDRDTAGAAEVIAAVLRAHVRAMIIGEKTRGEAVEFANFTLPRGHVARVAVAEVTLPESAPVFPGGLKPDLPVDVPPETTEAVLKQELESGVAGLVFETERPRMNEAALVAGTNPDLDAAQAAQSTKADKTKLPLRDAVLQRAVDFVTTLAIYEKKTKK